MDHKVGVFPGVMGGDGVTEEHRGLPNELERRWTNMESERRGGPKDSETEMVQLELKNGVFCTVIGVVAWVEAKLIMGFDGRVLPNWKARGVIPGLL